MTRQEEIQKDYAQYDKKGVEQLANFLQSWMANDVNKRDFKQLYKDAVKDGCPQYVVARLLFGHAYDWLAYGN